MFQVRTLYKFYFIKNPLKLAITKFQPELFAQFRTALIAQNIQTYVFSFDHSVYINFLEPFKVKAPKVVSANYLKNPPELALPQISLLGH